MIGINEFQRLPGENERQYLWRIGTKIENGTAGMTWDEAAPYINAEWRDDESEYRTSCAYRKPVQCAIAFYNDVFSRSENGDEERRLENLRESIRDERCKLQATKVELTRQQRIGSRFDLFYENIKEAFKQLDPPEMHPLRTSDEERQWVLGIGDIHYGSTFSSEHNTYNREIALQRFRILLGELQKEIAEKNISKLTIVNVSDTIQGILRISDVKINDVPVVQSVVEVSRLIASFLNDLSAYVEIDYYHVPCANHSQTRPLGSKASELAAEDMERIIIHYIHDVLAGNDRVHVYSNIGKDYVNFKIFDFNILALHGHQIKGINTALSDYTSFHRRVYDYMIVGHTHACEERCVGMGEDWNAEILVCPAFVGSDPYADTLLTGTQPMARLYEFDAKYGHKSSVNIFLK